jgi:hypothetical protein
MPSNVTVVWWKMWCLILTLFGIDMCINVTVPSDQTVFRAAEVSTGGRDVVHTLGVNYQLEYWE